MSATRTALLGLLDVLTVAVDPAPVRLADDEPQDGPDDPVATHRDDAPAEGAARSPDGAVLVRPIALERVGRSQRAGAVLDLELVAAVLATGPQALELDEAMLIALEPLPRYVVEPAPEALAFRVRTRVGVQMDGPVRWRVSEPLQVEVQIGRPMPGILIGPDGRGVAGAEVSAAVGGRGTSTDADGRFHLHVADVQHQRFVVAVRGTTRTVDASTETAPVVLRWE
jgi:hypothetical protein